jgi:hypothetical protein
MKIKKIEGYDRIPQRILVEGLSYLSALLAELFNKIYEEKRSISSGSHPRSSPSTKKSQKQN